MNTIIQLVTAFPWIAIGLFSGIADRVKMQYLLRTLNGDVSIMVRC